MRAAEYLVDNGLEKFNTWFDKESWYPLGRPVGASIYPGLQYTAATIYYSLQFLGLDVSINDVCVFIPAVFGVLATALLYLLAVEVTASHNAALVAAYVFSMLPAHLMRSVAGGFDNESIALAAMLGTFYLWLRSIRTCSSWPLGVLTGLAYFYMVMAWGGYIFVLNMIGVHCLMLLAMGRFSLNLHAAYSLFFVIGTYGAIQLPIVGNLPFSSLEQIGPLGVFLILQLFLFLHYCRLLMSDRAFRVFQYAFFGVVILLASVVLSYLLSTGYLGSFTSRIRSLFIPHTKTGNPLVDSVAEHQATHPTYYIRYLHMALYFALPGFYFIVKDYETEMTNGKLFGALFAGASFYFSNKMVRLMLLLSPAISYLSGVSVVVAIDWVKEQLSDGYIESEPEPNPAIESSPTTASSTTTSTASSTTTPSPTVQKPVAKVATSKPMQAPKPNFVPKGHAPRYAVTFFLSFFLSLCLLCVFVLSFLRFST
jgi:dolichyl-diphosphooligosaccharide--protein glycosyltransferase